MAKFTEWRLEVVEVPITVSLDAYTANDVVGGPLTSDQIEQYAGGCYINWIRLIDAADQAEAFQLYCYNAPPTTIADAAPFALVAADFAKLITVIDIPAANYSQDYSALAWARFHGKDVTTDEYHVFDNIPSGHMSLYLRCVDTPDYAAITDLTMHLGLMVP